MRDKYSFESGGNEFEADMVDVISHYAQKEWGNSSITVSTMNQDRYEGTDVFVLGVPVDVTINYQNKRHTRKLTEMLFDGITVEFGLRTGNGRKTFKTPVLVVGVEAAAGITFGNMWAVIDSVKGKIGDILDTGMDEYFAATEPAAA